MADEFGSVTPGKVADLVLVDGDPVTRISDVRRPVIVLMRGKLYESAELQRAIGVRPSG